MRRIFLVAESLPLKKDGTAPKTTAIGGLDILAPLDTRHGVFPNFVMTPLLAAIYALHSDGQPLDGLTSQLQELLSSDSDRRFNVFNAKKKEKNEPFIIHDKMTERILNYSDENDLWLLFGYQTSFGLLAWLLKKKRKLLRKDIEKFAVEFLNHAVSKAPKDSAWPMAVSKAPKTQHTGLLHRLCVEDDPNGIGVAQMLRHAISQEKGADVDGDVVFQLLRSSVPLLHNEAYQQGNIGNVQAHFVRSATGHKDVTSTGQAYWQVMGSAVGKRLLSRFVQRA